MAGKHGGKRPGAGRKKGAATKKTRAVADRAAAEGVTPLEVMLHVMRAQFEAKNLDAAVSIARHAAPYVHPRLSAVGITASTEQVVRTHVTLVTVDASTRTTTPGRITPGTG